MSVGTVTAQGSISDNYLGQAYGRVLKPEIGLRDVGLQIDYKNRVLKDVSRNDIQYTFPRNFLPSNTEV